MSLSNVLADWLPGSCKYCHMIEEFWCFFDSSVVLSKFYCRCWENQKVLWKVWYSNATCLHTNRYKYQISYLLHWNSVQMLFEKGKERVEELTLNIYYSWIVGCRKVRNGRSIASGRYWVVLLCCSMKHISFHPSPIYFWSTPSKRP